MTIIDTSKDEQQGERHQLWPKVHEFLEYTTAHGCGRLAASKGIPWKVFWITFFLAAHSMFWYQSALIVTDYLDRPIRTKISIEHAQVSNTLSNFIHLQQFAKMLLYIESFYYFIHSNESSMNYMYLFDCLSTN